MCVFHRGLSLFLIDRLIHISLCIVVVFFFFKQKTAYEMRISDWSSDVCSSDLWMAREMIGKGLDLRLNINVDAIQKQADGLHLSLTDGTTLVVEDRKSVV